MTTTNNSRFIPTTAIAPLALAAALSLGLATACGGDKGSGNGADKPGDGTGADNSKPDPDPTPKPAGDEFATYAALDVGADYASWPKLNKEPVKSKTHGGRYVDTYVNAVGMDAYKNDDAEIPEGTVIIKTSWETENDKPTEVAGPIFIMKRVKSDSGELTWWYGLHWEKVPEKWQKPMGGAQAYWRTPSAKVNYCVKCHDNFPRELGGIPKESRAY